MKLWRFGSSSFRVDVQCCRDENMDVLSRVLHCANHCPNLYELHGLSSLSGVTKMIHLVHSRSLLFSVDVGLA